MKKATEYFLLFFLLSCIVTSGCISNSDNSTAGNTTEDDLFKPDNFLKLTSLSEDNTTLTMIFDEYFDENFNSECHWELTIEPDDVLKISADEKILFLDNPSLIIGQHKWIFNENETGITNLTFRYVNLEKSRTLEKYVYTIKNTDGKLEILSIDSSSLSTYPQHINLIENNTVLNISCVEEQFIKWDVYIWKLEENPTEILNKTKWTADYTLGSHPFGSRQWEFEGKNSGNAILTLNYCNKDKGSAIEVIYEIHVNENKEISIRSMSYNSIKSSFPRDGIQNWDEVSEW